MTMQQQAAQGGNGLPHPATDKAQPVVHQATMGQVPPQHAAALPTDGTNIPAGIGLPESNQAWRPALATPPITAIGGGESAHLGPGLSQLQSLSPAA